jgi:hypothetical protein
MKETRVGIPPRHYTHSVMRERRWREQGIKFHGLPLTFGVWLKIKAVTRNRCALCGRDEFWGSLVADHNRDTGEVRGALDQECNRRAVGSVERWGHYRNPEVTARVRGYLADPPASHVPEVPA